MGLIGVPETQRDVSMGVDAVGGGGEGGGKKCHSASNSDGFSGGVNDALWKPDLSF